MSCSLRLWLLCFLGCTRYVLLVLSSPVVIWKGLVWEEGMAGEEGEEEESYQECARREGVSQGALSRH